jgi:hypothetical protein
VESAAYTYKMFITGVSMADILQAIYGRRTFFGCGLPGPSMDKPNIMAIFKEVFRKECIFFPIKYPAPDPEN